MQHDPARTASTAQRDMATSNNLARQITSAVEQFDAVNPDHKLPNVLALVNHAVGRSTSDLHVALTGIPVPDGPRLFTMKPGKQKELWEAARRVDLFLWIDAQKRSWQPVYAEDAVHRAAACGLFGIEIDKQESATTNGASTEGRPTTLACELKRISMATGERRPTPTA